MPASAEKRLEVSKARVGARTAHALVETVHPRNLSMHVSDPNVLPADSRSPLSHSSFCILMADVASLLLAFLVGGIAARFIDYHWFHAGFQEILRAETYQECVIFVGLGALSLLWLDSNGHYRHRLPFWEGVGHILSVSGIGFLICGFIEFASRSSFSRLWLAFSWVLFAGFLFTGRTLVRRHLTRTGAWSIPALLVGTGASAEAAMHSLSREPTMGFDIVEQIAPETLGQVAASNSWRTLMHACGACHIILALDGAEFDDYRMAVKSLVRERLPCSIVPPWMSLPTGTLSPHHFLMHDVLLLHDTNRLTLPMPRFLKRGFDILVSGVALLTLSPLFVYVALRIRKDGGPAFFKQDRIGKGGQKFGCFKFRSMRIGAEAYLDQYLSENPAAAEEWRKFQKLKDDVRITPFGHFIRRASIDELPQLINVLLGDMSIVGPRPITSGQEEYYGEDFIYYESVRPGITGPWQVSGRNKLTFSERVALEASYARNWSLWLDIVILLKTVPALLSKDEAF